MCLQHKQHPRTKGYTQPHAAPRKHLRHVQYGNCCVGNCADGGMSARTTAFTPNAPSAPRSKPHGNTQCRSAASRVDSGVSPAMYMSHRNCLSWSTYTPWQHQASKQRHQRSGHHRGCVRCWCQTRTRRLVCSCVMGLPNRCIHSSRHTNLTTSSVSPIVL